MPPGGAGRYVFRQTVSTSLHSSDSNSDWKEIGAGKNVEAKVIITGGNIQTNQENMISSPTNGSEDVSPVVITLSGSPDETKAVTVPDFSGYGLRDVYPLNSKLCFYLPAGAIPPAKVVIDGVAYNAVFLWLRAGLRREPIREQLCFFRYDHAERCRCDGKL